MRPAIFFLCYLVTAVWAAAAERPFAVTVYCGASRDTAEGYRREARKLGEELGRRGWTLVYGGGRTGSMGEVASGAKAAGGRVESVLPRFLERPSVVFPEADELVVVETMAARKAELQRRADAFVILPGGFGTLDEFADTLELARFGLQRKPIYLLNQGGYFDALLAFFDRVASEGFARDDDAVPFVVVATVEELVERLAGDRTVRVADENS